MPTTPCLDPATRRMLRRHAHLLLTAILAVVAVVTALLILATWGFGAAVARGEGALWGALLLAVVAGAVAVLRRALVPLYLAVLRANVTN